MAAGLLHRALEMVAGFLVLVPAVLADAITGHFVNRVLHTVTSGVKL